MLGYCPLARALVPFLAVLNKQIRQSYKLANARILTPLIMKKGVFVSSYASAAGASGENWSNFCDIFLENAMNKNLPSECFDHLLHVGKYCEKQIFSDEKLPVTFSKNYTFEQKSVCMCSALIKHQI